MFTGSGMPMRFADLDGSMIDVYQAATQMTDESGQSYPFTIDTLLDKALGPEGYYGVFTANMHTDSVDSLRAPTRSSPRRRRAACRSSPRAQMLTWLDGRNNSSFSALAWNGNKLTFTIDLGAGRKRPTGDGADRLRGWAADRCQAERHLRSRRRRRRSRASSTPSSTPPPAATRRPTRSTTPRPAISNVTDAVTATARRRSPGTPTSPPTRGSTTAPTPAPRRQPEQLRARHLAQRAAHRPRPEHHLLLPGELDRRAPATPRTDPLSPAAPRHSRPLRGLTDTTVADFGAGTPDANTYVSETGDGEVTLRPTVGEEFSAGPGLPPAGQAAPGEPETCGPAGSATVSGGSLHVDGAFAGTTATYGSGRTLEFSATFGGADFEHVGFSDDFNDSPTGRSSASGPTAASTPAPTTAAPNGHAASSALLGSRTATGSSGTRPRSATTSTAASSPPTRPTSAPPRCARPPATSTPAAPDALGRLAPHEPLPGLGQLHLAGPRRGPDRAPTGARSSGAATAPGATGLAISVRTGNTRPRRELERVHPDHAERRRHPRQLALCAVPRRS